MTLAVDVTGGEHNGYDEHGVDVYTSCSSLSVEGGSPSAEDVAEQRTLPKTFALQGNTPNPVRGKTQIRFALPEAAPVELVVYDAQGREVAQLVDGSLPAGFHQVPFDASGLSSGVYLYRMRAGTAFTDTGTLVVVK